MSKSKGAQVASESETVPPNSDHGPDGESTVRSEHRETPHLSELTADIDTAYLEEEGEPLSLAEEIVEESACRSDDAPRLVPG